LDDLFEWQSVGLIIADYVADGKMMGRGEWASYYGVDIGPETNEIKKVLEFSRFYQFYHGPNPVDVFERKTARQICETCLIPTIVPKKVIPTVHVMGINLINLELERDFHLQVLGELAEHPKSGHAAKYVVYGLDGYVHVTNAWKQLARKGTDRMRVVFLLKGVVARNKPWGGQVEYLNALNDATGYGCETKPDTLSQNTALMAHHAVTGERPFGDGSGIEGRETYGRTVELVIDYSRPISSGNFSAGAVDPLGGCAPAELSVCEHDLSANREAGVVVLRKLAIIGVWIDKAPVAPSGEGSLRGPGLRIELPIQETDL